MLLARKGGWSFWSAVEEDGPDLMVLLFCRGLKMRPAKKSPPAGADPGGGPSKHSTGLEEEQDEADILRSGPVWLLRCASESFPHVLSLSTFSLNQYSLLNALVYNKRILKCTSDHGFLDATNLIVFVNLDIFF